MIVAPSSAAAASIRTAAARYGRPLVNIEALTPSGLAFHIWKTHSPADVSKFVSERFMQLVLAATLSRGTDAQSPLFLRSISTTVRTIVEDRMAGRDARWAESQASSASQQMYANLFRVYEQFLLKSSRVDHSDVLRSAVELAPAFRTERHLSVLLVCAEVQITRLQADLVNQLGSGSSTSLLLGTPESIWPTSFAGSVLEDWGYAPADVNSLADELPVLQSSTRREEVLSAVMDVIGRGLPFSDVEFAYTNDSSYPTIISSISDRLSINSSLNHTSRSRRASEFIRGFCKWVMSGYDAEPLLHMLRSGLIQTDAVSSELATVLDQFRVSFPSLDNPDLRGVLMEGAKLQRISFEKIDALLDFLHDLRGFIAPQFVTPAQMVGILKRFCHKYFEAKENESVCDEIVDSSFSDFADESLSSLSSSWIADNMLQVLQRTDQGNDSGSGLLVSPISEAGYGPRPYCYVLGLDDKACSGAESNSDSHFAGFESTNSATDRLSVRLLVSELARRYTDRLTLSVAAYDVAENRTLYPGSPLLELTSVRDLDPVSRLSQVDHADELRSSPSIANAGQFPGIHAGINADRKRASSEWTAFDGVVPSAPEDVEISIRTSPSRVEVLAACPFRYFLGEILEIPVPPRAQEDWISKADEGNILHALFERHGRARIEGQAGVDSEDEAAIMEELSKALQRQAIRSGSDLQALIEQKTEELASGVRQYFRRERELKNQRHPVAVELQFVDPEDAAVRHISISLPSGTLHLTGRIDRVDESSDGSWVVVDYKSGGYSDFVPKKLKALDDKLQWALYSLAASRMSGKTVKSAEYFFTSRKGAGWISGAATPAEEELLPKLDALIARIKSGSFIQAAEEKGPCQWCDFKPVCGDLTARKLSKTRKFEVSPDPMANLFESWPHRPKTKRS